LHQIACREQPIIVSPSRLQLLHALGSKAPLAARRLFAPGEDRMIAILVNAASMLLSMGSAYADGPAVPVQLSTPGCQGEGCRDSGEWVANADLPLFADVHGGQPMGRIARGTRVTALRGLVVTTRVGIGVTLSSAAHLPGDASRQSLVPLPAGTRIRTLYYEGEGIVIAIAPSGERIGIEQSAFRVVTDFVATDWVRLRLPDGRTAWPNRREQFRCSSHIDDTPGECRGI
jgi:hypothetical protein